jgi:hypothetical protein
VSSQIQPADFAGAMERHWSDNLNNVASPRLMALWETMAKTFNSAMASDNQRWAVLQPPTGTGKTQGLAVFSAMTAKANREADCRQGILIVTRLIEQANELQASIDEMAGFKCAVAKHSENTVTSAQMRESDILIVTHAAYVMALDSLCQDDKSRWSDLIEWDHGKRSLTVIDEALANVIDSYQIKADDIRLVLAYVTPEIRTECPSQVRALEIMMRRLDELPEITEALEGDDKHRSRVVWRGVADGRIEFPDSHAMPPLRSAMASLKYDRLTLHKDSPLDRQRIAAIVDKTLKDVEALLSKWHFYAKKGKEHSFNASQLLIPTDLPAPVVLDATAKQNFLWELLEDRADIKAIPPNTRNYRNVTLHVARASGVGKTTMITEGPTRIPRLLAELEKKLGSSRKVFLCLHQRNEHIPKGYAPAFEEFAVGHWGAIDGKNDWKDFDTAVIFGLPYRDHLWATNAFFAIQGIQDDDWIKNPRWKSYSDVRDELQVKQITVSVVQAINRIQCRKVVDDQGNCAASDVFIVLPRDDKGDRILEAIAQEMPGISTMDWAFELDGAQVTVRKGSSHEALVIYMSNQSSGETSMADIQKVLGLGSDGMKKLKASLRDPAHALTVQLNALGVSMISSGYGKGQRAYLQKV